VKENLESREVYPERSRRESRIKRKSCGILQFIWCYPTLTGFFTTGIAQMNYLDASIRGVKFQKNKSQIPKKENTMQASFN